jgi:hypothetical protein
MRTSGDTATSVVLACRHEQSEDGVALTGLLHQNCLEELMLAGNWVGSDILFE